MGESKRLLQWNRREREARLHRRPGGLDRRRRMESARFRGPVPPGARQHPRSARAGERKAGAHRAADLVCARQARVPRLAEGRGDRVPRAHGQALPDDGGGTGERARRGRGEARDRSDGGPTGEMSMKVSVIGGGPGGLYFALLAKKAWPRWDITVYERNRPDDTFGFGVVFSDQTLATFKANDLVTYERIRRRFAYWRDVDVLYKGRVMR